MKRILLAGLLLAWAGAAAELTRSLPPETARFRPGAGAEIATGQCLICHSADYISTQPRLGRKAWQASVQKMKDKYGAPLETNQIPALVEYLVKTYGDEAPAGKSQ